MVRHQWSDILLEDRAAHGHVSSEGKKALADWFLLGSPNDMHQHSIKTDVNLLKVGTGVIHTKKKGAREFLLNQLLYTLCHD